MLYSCSEQEYVPRQAEEQARSIKRGVSFGFQFEEDIRILGAGASWSYNWGPSSGAAHDPAMAEAGIDFYPMAWNGINEAALKEYLGRHPECEYLLGFNEPNLTDQANMTPQQAAERWPEIVRVAKENGLKLISPAMNYGTLEGYHDPIVWLDEFFSLVSIEDIDAIAIHCYMPNASAVKNYIDRFRKYARPVWLTEFCAWDGLSEGTFQPEGQQKYLSDIINYLEADPLIERYAWFIPRGSGSHNAFPYMFLLKSHPVGVPTDLGRIYLQMSTQDKETWYVEQQRIEAEHYSSINIAESVEGDWTRGPLLRVTTDAPNESLELYQFLPDQWVEYQIEADRSKEFSLELRYATFVDSELEILIDGRSAGTVQLPSTGENFIWSTASITLPLDAGRQSLRISPTDGMICLNWIQFI